MPKYAELIYNGFWFSPSARCSRRRSHSQAKVSGTVRLKLYKGWRAWSAARAHSLYSERHVTFETMPGLRPEGRRGLHQAQCPPSAPSGAAESSLSR